MTCSSLGDPVNVVPQQLCSNTSADLIIISLNNEELQTNNHQKEIAHRCMPTCVGPSQSERLRLAAWAREFWKASAGLSCIVLAMFALLLGPGV